MRTCDMLRVLLGNLLDVDAAHVAEDHHRQLGEGVVGDGSEVLLRDSRLRLDEDAAGPLAPYLKAQDSLRGRFRLFRRAGELDPAGLHAAAREHLRLQHDGPPHLPGPAGGPPPPRGGGGGPEVRACSIFASAAARSCSTNATGRRRKRMPIDSRIWW